MGKILTEAESIVNQKKTNVCLMMMMMMMMMMMICPHEPFLRRKEGRDQPDKLLVAFVQPAIQRSRGGDHEHEHDMMHTTEANVANRLRILLQEIRAESFSDGLALKPVVCKGCEHLHCQTSGHASKDREAETMNMRWCKQLNSLQNPSENSALASLPFHCNWFAAESSSDGLLALVSVVCVHWANWRSAKDVSICIAKQKSHFSCSILCFALCRQSTCLFVPRSVPFSAACLRLVITSISSLHSESMWPQRANIFTDSLSQPFAILVFIVLSSNPMLHSERQRVAADTPLAFAMISLFLPSFCLLFSQLKMLNAIKSSVGFFVKLFLKLPWLLRLLSLLMLLWWSPFSFLSLSAFCLCLVCLISLQLKMLNVMKSPIGLFCQALPEVAVAATFAISAHSLVLMCNQWDVAVLESKLKAPCPVILITTSQKQAAMTGAQVSRRKDSKPTKMKWNEMKWNEMKWNEMKWNEMKWNEMKWNEGKERKGKERKQELRRRKDRRERTEPRASSSENWQGVHSTLVEWANRVRNSHTEYSPRMKSSWTVILTFVWSTA